MFINISFLIAYAKAVTSLRGEIIETNISLFLFPTTFHMQRLTSALSKEYIEKFCREMLGRKP